MYIETSNGSFGCYLEQKIAKGAINYELMFQVEQPEASTTITVNLENLSDLEKISNYLNDFILKQKNLIDSVTHLKSIKTLKVSAND